MESFHLPLSFRDLVIPCPHPPDSSWNVTLRNAETLRITASFFNNRDGYTWFFANDGSTVAAVSSIEAVCIRRAENPSL